MPVEVKVRSNVGALSAARLHEALVRMVADTLRDAETFLRADRVAHSRKGLLAAHIRKEDVNQLVELIEARLGVSEIPEADARTPLSHGLFRRSHYPMFVEVGTRTPITSPRGNLMWNRREGIIARKAVRGQRGQRYMLATFELVKELLKHDPQIRNALREMQGRASAEAAAIRAT